MLKRILCLILALVCITSVVACDTTGDDKETDGKENDTSVTDGSQSDTEEKEPDTMLEKSGIILTDEFTFAARSYNDKIRESVELTRISKMDEKYVSKSGGAVFVDVNSPYFEIGGGYVNEHGRIVRYAADASEDNRATNPAGVTIRFCTSAASITLKAAVANIYSDDNTVPRGAYGFDVYVGTGNDRTEQGDHLQKITSANLNETVSLPGGTKEVLLYLPQIANLNSFALGFNSATVGVSLPLERDYAPVVFYGSSMTQGAGSSRGGNSYTNLVTRMLNADCINLGFMSGAHGEAEIAQYIASLESISAFVMEFDNGATLDELKANHYNFYKTVRDAHPDIPIIIMTDLVFSEADRAERGERVEVIADTYKKALAAGDKKVWLLDGDDVFPIDDMLDMYTADLINPNNTGHYYLATCIYDILNSAFTPDAEKKGVEREVGFKDSFEYELYSYDDKIMDAEYVKVSSLDESLVARKNDGFLCLTLSTPQFDLGGLIHPDDNMGEFYRVPYERKDEFLSNLIEKASYTTLLNHTTGGTVRFRTNADEILVMGRLEQEGRGDHASYMGLSGLEVYVGTGNDRVYCEERGQTIVGSSFTETVKLPEGYKEVMITLPNYSGIQTLYIGLPADAEIAAPTERDHAPLLYYGTSITQGACASRSSLAFANLTARWLNTDLIHLGFSGSGRGEQIMADFMASYANDVSAFVMNYDANSPASEMRERCYPVYKTVRDANPDLPIFLMTCPYFNDVREGFREECYEIMKDTYERAIAEGDTNVYLIDCRDVFPEELHVLRDNGVVDYCHLTDTGMYYTAREIYAMVKEVLEK